MNLSFMHIRDHDDEGNLLSTGGATIAYNISRQADHLHIKCAYAECLAANGECTGDRFRKDIGRDIATARMLDDKNIRTIIVPLDQEDDVEAYIYMSYLEAKSDHWDDVRKYYYPHKRSFDLPSCNPDAILHPSDPDNICSTGC